MSQRPDARGSRCRRSTAASTWGIAVAICWATFLPAMPGGDTAGEKNVASAREGRGDLVIELPLRPLAAAKRRTVGRAIDLTRSENGVRIHGAGDGEATYDLSFEQVSDDELAAVIQVSGVADCRLRASQRRASATARLHSRIDAEGGVLLTGTGFAAGAMRIDVRNMIVPTNTTWDSRLGVASRLGGRIVGRVLDAQLPTLKMRTEHEMRRTVAAELATSVRQAVHRANDAATTMARTAGETFDASLRLRAVAVTDRARLHFDVHDPSKPHAECVVAPPAALGVHDQLVIHVADTLPAVLARRLRGMQLAETDFRDLCLEPLGLVPEFDAEVVFGGPPTGVLFATDDPLAVVISRHALAFDARLAGFTDSAGRFHGVPCRIAAEYDCVPGAEQLRLKRRGRPRIECHDPRAAASLEVVAARFFCARAESTEVTAVKEVLASIGMTLAGLELGDRWMTLTIGHDPDVLIKELLP